MGQETADLQVLGVDFSYGEKPLLEQVSLQVKAGEVCAILGASGCGKSTLLKIICGLLVPSSGEIRWKGKNILTVPTHERGFAMMMQGAKLFPHRSVAANIAFPMWQKIPWYRRFDPRTKARIKQRVEELLSLVGMSDYYDNSALALSGGQAQRIALARSLAADPQLLLLDEPLSALDRNLRENLLPVLREIFRQLHLGVIYVTHDQDEAFYLADKIVVMQDGKILSVKTPAQLWADPGSVTVAKFIGYGPFLSSEQAQKCGVSIPAGYLLGLSEKSFAVAELNDYARQIRKPGNSAQEPPFNWGNPFKAVVNESYLVRGKQLAILDLEGIKAKASFANRVVCSPGTELKVQIDLQESVVLKQ